MPNLDHPQRRYFYFFREETPQLPNKKSNSYKGTLGSAYTPTLSPPMAKGQNRYVMIHVPTVSRFVFVSVSHLFGREGTKARSPGCPPSRLHCPSRGRTTTHKCGRRRGRGRGGNNVSLGPGGGGEHATTAKKIGQMIPHGPFQDKKYTVGYSISSSLTYFRSSPNAQWHLRFQS